MPGIYLECDGCGAICSGESHHPRGLSHSQTPTLIAEARTRGWATNLDTEHDPAKRLDFCSTCAPKEDNG